MFPPKVEQWRYLVNAFFPECEVINALCVIEHESSGDPSSVNNASTEGYGGSIGLMQIAADNLGGTLRIKGLESWPIVSITLAKELLLIPAVNILIGSQIHAANGWLPAWEADKETCNLK